MAKISHIDLPAQMRPEKVGERLMKMRLALTSEGKMDDICKAAGIDNSAYSKYERGTRLLPPHKAYLISRYYGVDLDYLLAGDPSALTLEALRKLGVIENTQT